MIQLKLPFDRQIVDEKYFYPVEKHQIVNFKKQIGSRLEQGVSENHFLCKQEALQRCLRQLGPTLDLLAKRPEHIYRREKLKKRRKRPNREGLENVLKRSFHDMSNLIDLVEKEKQLKQQVRKKLKASQELDKLIPPVVQAFLHHMQQTRDPESDQYQLLFPEKTEFLAMANSPLIQVLVSFAQWFEQESLSN